MFKTVLLNVLLMAATTLSAPLQERGTGRIKEMNSLSTAKNVTSYYHSSNTNTELDSSIEKSNSESEEYDMDIFSTEDPLYTLPQTISNMSLLEGVFFPSPPPWIKKKTTDYEELDPFYDGDEEDDDAENYGDLTMLNSDLIQSFAPMDGRISNSHHQETTESAATTETITTTETTGATTDLPESTTPVSSTGSIDVKADLAETTLSPTTTDITSTTEPIETTTLMESTTSTESEDTTTPNSINDSVDITSTTEVIQTTEASELVDIISTTEAIDSTTMTTEESTESNPTTIAIEAARMFNLADTTDISTTTESIEVTTTTEPPTTEESTTADQTTEATAPDATTTNEENAHVSTEHTLRANILIQKPEVLESMASMSDIIIINPKNLTLDDASSVEVHEESIVKQTQTTDNIAMTMDDNIPIVMAVEEVKMNAEGNLSDEVKVVNEEAPPSVTGMSMVLHSSTTSTTECIRAVESAADTVVDTEVEAEAEVEVNVAAPEARSLNMPAPPPKLTRHLSEDGVEVISGYSFVKHN